MMTLFELIVSITCAGHILSFLGDVAECYVLWSVHLSLSVCHISCIVLKRQNIPKRFFTRATLCYRG